MICLAASGACLNPDFSSCCRRVVFPEPGPPDTTKRLGLFRIGTLSGWGEGRQQVPREAGEEASLCTSPFSIYQTQAIENKTRFSARTQLISTSKLFVRVVLKHAFPRGFAAACLRRMRR